MTDEAHPTSMDRAQLNALHELAREMNRDRCEPFVTGPLVDLARHDFVLVTNRIGRDALHGTPLWKLVVWSHGQRMEEHEGSLQFVVESASRLLSMGKVAESSQHPDRGAAS